uniref:Obscurin like cytoskeletal adaptor 1b n=1 Tax=Salmo trutta TaxID=8032 RepID=A0A674B4R0_SALTR
MDVFGGAPRFLAYPRPVVVQSGTDAVLKCQIGGDPRPAVIWERNNEQIHPEGRYRFFEDGNVYNLIISSVTTEDSGQYTCKAKNSIGETYAAATLKVEGEAQEMELREENKPRFLIKPLSTRVGRGEDAVFSCKLWGNPRPEVVWEKDGRKLNEIFESTHFNVGYQDGGWFQLKIFKTRAPDGGVYTCKARNEFGEGLAGAVLLVDAGPGHEEEGNPKQVKMFAVTEGKHAKFRCFVTGKPKPEIIWRKDGRLIMSGRRYLLYEDREGYFTLKVLYCKQQDNGVYVCAASNTAGQTLSAVHLSVKEPPVRFKQPLIDLEVWERDLAVLECEVPEDSVPITWYLEDRRLQPGAKYGMEEWGTKRRLTIRDIGVDDDGIYLCEMADGGRSIAEVAVKGTIVRKLPRKVDVLEGENAAFCVEVEEEEMDIHWYKEGTELRETHQTILKSFGKTHILVFVNTTPQDSGLVTFFVGRSKTSSQLRVKAARHSPPSCPVGVQINTERANAALLSWVPAQDTRKNPPSGYVLERQEVGTGSQEWLQCLTTDSATSVEILGDSVPCEADYRFRICSVNKYGRSNNLEFPRAVHLVPVTRIQAPLQDALVPEGQDACFSIELTASVIGSWFLNGTQLLEDDRYSMRRSRTHQSLRIQGVRDTDNGAEITFIAYGIRDSAALYIQAPPVRFSALPEAERNKSIEAGCPIVLQCELSDPTAQVYWYKDGTKLLPQSGIEIQSDGITRTLVVQSAEIFYSGSYSCKTKGDAIKFNVDVKDLNISIVRPVRFSVLPEAERNKSIEAGCPIVLKCELSDPTAQVYWYKDGTKLFSNHELDIQSEGNMRMLVVQSAELTHSGTYSCTTVDETMEFHVDIKVTFSAIFDVEKTKSVEAGCPFQLQCEVTDPTAQVYWCKDGEKLLPQTGMDIQSNGTMRRLIVQSAEVFHSGLYNCETSDDTLQFTVDIKAPPVRITTPCEAERNKSVAAGGPIVLRCEISDPNAHVSWYKDGTLLHEENGLEMQSKGSIRTLDVESARLSDAGSYSCKTTDDAMQFHVDVKALPEVVRNKFIEAGCPIVLQCELSDPTAQVFWYKDGTKLLPENGVDIQSEGALRAVILQSAELSHSGVYSCEALDDCIAFKVDVAEVERNTSIEAGCPIVLQCELSDPSGQICWYKDGIKLLPQYGIHIQSEGTMRTLVIQSATFSSSGVYSCKTADDITPPVTFVDIPEEDLFKSVVEQDRLVMSCEVSRVDAIVQWYKDGVETQSSDNVSVQADCTVRMLTIQSAQLSDSGTYTCRAGDRALMFKVNIRETPLLLKRCLIFNRVEMFVGDSLVLDCEVSRSNAAVSWKKNGEEMEESSNVTVIEDGVMRQLTIHSMTLEDAGQYVCDAKDDVMDFQVKIKARTNISGYENESVTLCAMVNREQAYVRWLKDGELLNGDNIHISSAGKMHTLIINPLKLSDSGGFVCNINTDEIPLENIVALKDSTLTLRCEVNKAKGDVQWLKDGQEIKPSRQHTIRAQGRERSITIHQLMLDNAGEYACESTDDRTFATVGVESKDMELHNITVLEGEDATFKCVVSPEDTLLVWSLNGRPIAPNERFVISSNGLCHMLCIYNCQVSDCATVTAEAEGLVSEANLQVQGETPLVNIATLEVEVGLDSGEVQWMRQGVVIHPGPKFTLKQKSRRRSLTIHKLALSDRGTYSCETLHDRTQAQLIVERECGNQIEG